MKVLLAIEISDQEFSSSIVDFVLAHNWPDQTEFLVMHAIPLDEAETFGGAREARELLRSAELSALSAVNTFAEPFKKKFGGASVSTKVELGHPNELILETSKSWQSEFIFLGSRGLRGLKKLFLGSVSSTVAANANCSVMVVSRQDTTESANESPKRILVPVSEEALAEDLCHFLYNHSWPDDSELKFFYVLESLLVGSPFSVLPSAVLEERKEERRKEASKLLEKLVKESTAALPKMKISQEIVEGFPKESILSFAVEWKANLIAMGSHGRKGINRLILGSVSSGVLNHAPCSVLILH